MTNRQFLPEIPVLPSDDGIFQESNDVTDFGKSFFFDFDSNPPDFNLNGGQLGLLTGVDNLKQWIRKSFLTRKGVVPIYSYAFGTELNDLLGRGFTLRSIAVIIEDIIRNSLIQHNKIVDIVDFETEIVTQGIKVEFKVITSQDDSFTIRDIWVTI